MTRQIMTVVQIMLPPRLIMVLDDLRKGSITSRNSILRAILSYVLEHPEIIEQVFPYKQQD